MGIAQPLSGPPEPAGQTKERHISASNNDQKQQPQRGAESEVE